MELADPGWYDPDHVYTKVSWVVRCLRSTFHVPYVRRLIAHTEGERFYA